MTFCRSPGFFLLLHGIGGAMRKTIPVLFLILCIGVMSAAAYTVVLKNGKTMTGTLISETDQVILFKDDGGVQYSLKKANLDLAKMTEANAAPVQPEPAAVTPPPAPEVPKKKGRVYTKEDVDNLRAKYPELSIGEAIENPEDFESGVLKPEAYVSRIQEGGTRVNESLGSLGKLRDATATAWEMAASTGKDPSEAVNAALSTDEAKAILKDVSDELTSLGRWQESMSNAPDQYKDGYNMYVQSITDLSDFQRGIREWNTFENVNAFRTRLNELESRLNSTSSRLQNWRPQGAPPPPAEPEEETEETEEESEEIPPIQ